MFSITNRAGLNRIGLNTISVSSRITPATLAPFRGLKTIPQPPGYVVGTVNDAYVPPKPSKSHGSYHWTSERAVSIALIPFCAAPVFLGATTAVDSIMSGLLLFHCYTGFQSCIIDYIPKRVYGPYHHYAMYLLTFGTGVAAYGIYEIETKEGGVTNILSKLWKA